MFYWLIKDNGKELLADMKIEEYLLRVITDDTNNHTITLEKLEYCFKQHFPDYHFSQFRIRLNPLHTFSFFLVKKLQAVQLSYW